MRHQRQPDAKERKANTKENENVDRLQKQVNEQNKRDKGKVMLRIDHRTVILVNKKNKNKKYAEEYQRKLEHDRYVETYSPKDKKNG